MSLVPPIKLVVPIKLVLGEFLGENESQKMIMMIFPTHGCWGIFFVSNEQMSMMVMRLVSPMVVFFRKMSHGR